MPSVPTRYVSSIEFEASQDNKSCVDNKMSLEVAGIPKPCNFFTYSFTDRDELFERKKARTSLFLHRSRKSKAPGINSEPKYMVPSKSRNIASTPSSPASTMWHAPGRRMTSLSQNRNVRSRYIFECKLPWASLLAIISVNNF